MNQNELNEMLNEMDAEERELTLAADDAYDRLYAYKLHKKYGVTVECNPGGDRTKVAIDGVIMNHEQFAAWLLSKEMAQMSESLATYASGDDEDIEDMEDDELPSDVLISYEDLQDPDDLNEIKSYLRESYGHYLARGTQPAISWDEDVEVVHVGNIQWGRAI